MDDVFIGQISTKRTPSGRAHYVRVPSDWAEQMIAQGYRNVIVKEDGTSSRGLVLSRFHDDDLKEFRRQRRNQRASERYYGTR